VHEGENRIAGSCVNNADKLFESEIFLGKAQIARRLPDPKEGNVDQ